MRTAPRARLGVPISILLAALTLGAPLAWSCALEGGLLSSNLSLQHPRSPEVAFAMQDAIERGELKHDPAPANAFALLKARSRLQQLRAPLARGGIATDGGFAIVLIEYGLWSRLRVDGDNVAMQFHVDGPAEGDIVVVTGALVIDALLDGRLSGRQALAQRLIVVDEAGAAVEAWLDRSFASRAERAAIQ